MGRPGLIRSEPFLGDQSPEPLSLRYLNRFLTFRVSGAEEREICSSSSAPPFASRTNRSRPVVARFLEAGSESARPPKKGALTLESRASVIESSSSSKTLEFSCGFGGKTRSFVRLPRKNLPAL
ncbi:hypothetical protein C4D60_Mb04t10670 [Musa balbisiana]|uniref:Uncharacterized protein n=1 Tax=Musa balbisiana TaxID=52838 RepID=A0A4S8KB41_MUSBA|nr:hypothetical protein C4D60_Mb04t10670 [Musa balbisiana]